MNKFQATIKDKATDGEISYITASDGDLEFCILVLENSKFNVGDLVQVSFNSAEVVVVLENEISISLCNKIRGKVVGLKTQGVLSVVKIAYKNNIFSALITSVSLERLRLKMGLEISFFIKSTDVILEGIR